MRLFGLIGYPLTHSFSKKYFTEKFSREGIHDCKYELFSIATINELNAVLRNHPELCGLNVTIPYKEAVLNFLHERNELVRTINACNCIKITSGKIEGFNTDAIGFESSLKERLLPHHKKALVLGSGGAAKAVKFVLDKLGIIYKQVSRKKAEDSLVYEELSLSIIAEYQVIINTTPLGTFPNVLESPDLPYEAITTRHYLFDMVYNPAKSLFLQRGEERGAIVKNGYDMLVIQAEESWKIWNKKNN